jgi:hypothetical protein
MEVDGVKKEDFGKVVDQCYLCDLCYMTKCPYVPPHPWNVDFPHVMLRAKAIKFEKGIKFRDALLSSTDAIGKLAAIPVVAQTVNVVNKNRLARTRMQSSCSACTRTASSRRTRRTNSAAIRGSLADFPVEERQGDTRQGGGVRDLLRQLQRTRSSATTSLALLEHNEIPYVWSRGECAAACPSSSSATCKGVNALKEKNIPVLARYAREGYAILAPVPSCALMFKQELPLMYPDDADTIAVRDAMFDPFEYFVLQKKRRSC